MIPLDGAIAITHELLDMDTGILANHFEKFLVCGSIRRKRLFVNDIDIVAIQKKNYEFGERTLSQNIADLDPNGLSESLAKGRSSVSRFLDGDAIKRFKYKGIMIDLYLATPENFGTLVLIRTGSANHNIKLTTIAKSKGWKLYANGDGLWSVSGSGDTAKKIKLIDNTEDGIMQILLGKVVPPQERE